MATDYVKTGVFWDYDRSLGANRQLLVGIKIETALSNFIAIIVTIAVARIWRLIARLHNWYYGYTKADEGLYWEAAIESQGWHKILFSREELPGDIVLPVAGKWKKRFCGTRLKRFTWNIFGGVILLLLYVLGTALGVLTLYLKTEPARALSNHPQCGIYLPNTTNSRLLPAITRPVEYEKQLESALIARECYGDGDANSGICSFFLNPVMDVQSGDTDCPFQDLCYDDKLGYKLSTPAMPGRILGLNAAKTYEFRRETVCAPLKMNDTLIPIFENGCERTRRYMYGSTTGFGNATWVYTNYGDEVAGTSSYTLDVLTGPSDVWTPLSQLQFSQHATTTIMFISSGKTLYPERREAENDPIFPREKEVILGDGTTIYQNGRGHAGVLACVDENLLRDPTINSEWTSLYAYDFSDVEKDDLQNQGVFKILFQSLLYSSIYRAVADRSSDVLNAQNLLANKISLPLEPHHWKMEVKQMFTVSLARMHVEARDIARGTASNRDGFLKQPNAESLCKDTYIFQPDGYSNLNVNGYIAIFVVAVLLWIFAIPVLDGEVVLIEAIAVLIVGGERAGYSVEPAHRRIWEWFSERAESVWEWLRMDRGILETLKHTALEWAEVFIKIR